MNRDPKRELSAVESVLWFAAAISYVLAILGLAAAVVLVAVFARN